MRKKKEDFSKEKEIFLEHIQKAGLHKPGERDLILEIFLRTEEHLTSEDLYWLVQKQDPSVGHTTVYRTLKLLTEAGLKPEWSGLAITRRITSIIITMSIMTI